MDIFSTVKRFGITIGIFSKEHWNDLSKENKGNMPFIIGRYYTFKNENEGETNCGFQTLAQFLNRDDAQTYYENESKYLRR